MLPGPMRPRYPKYMADKELLSSLAEVDDLVILNYLYLHLKANLGPINTAKKSISSKGKSWVQRLRKGHRCCQPLLWRLNCLWYQTIIFSHLDPFLKTVNKILWVVILTINSTQKYVSIDFVNYQSSRDLRRWPGWTSSPALVGSVDSAWGSASSPSLRSSTGSPSGFAGPWCHTMSDSNLDIILSCFKVGKVIVNVFLFSESWDHLLSLQVLTTS